MALAVLLPEDILSRSTFARTFADAVASIVPSIDKLTALSHFPEVAKFFGAVFWAFLSVGVVLAFLFPEPINRQLLREHALRTAISVPLIAVLLVGFLYFFFITETPIDLTDLRGHGDALLGLVGSITFLAQVLVLYACVRTLTLLPEMFSGRGSSIRSTRREDCHAGKR